MNTAAELAQAMIAKGIAGKAAGDPARKPWVLSVGSTPSAHAASAETRAQLKSILNGTLELHAGR